MKLGWLDSELATTLDGKLSLHGGWMTGVVIGLGDWVYDINW